MRRNDALSDAFPTPLISLLHVGGFERTECCEQGMHSFQTLLEAHTDLAFDFFEAWSHRNIFVINANLPVVATHHKGLDLETPPETERELQIEVESSRRRLEHVRVIPLFFRSLGGA